jgi:hypothetical protein
MNPGTDPRFQAELGRRDFHQEEVSSCNEKFSLPIGCERKTRPNVMQGQQWEVGYNLLG